MEPLINILHLEDDPVDAELVQANLAEAGLVCRISVAQTRDAFESALRNGGMDIILADYQLPMYDGMAALMLAQEVCPDVPFIFVSGAMGEEAAIEALTKGSTDYVLKQNLSRLAPAVERALLEAQNRKERKQAQIRLREQFLFLRQLLDSIPIPVYYKDTQGLYLDCNAAFVTFIGLPKKDIVGKTVHEVVPKERADKHHEADLELLGNPGVQIYEVSDIFQNGTYHDVIFHKATFVDTNDCVAGTVGTIVDITERKQAEHERLTNLRFFESMEKVNQAIQGADDLEDMMKDLLDVVISIFDCDRAFLMYPCDPESPEWTSPMERSKPAYPGVRDLKQAIPMDPQVAETLRILLDTDGPVAFGPGSPHKLPEKVSKQFNIQSVMSMAIYPKTGSPWQFGMHQCISARVWTAEEMRMFEAIGRRLADALSSLLTHRDLRQNEAFLDKVVEYIPDMIFVKEAQTLSFVRFNKAGEQLLGYQREELLGKSDYDFYPKEEADFFTEKDRQVLTSKELVDIPEEIICTKSNQKRILHTKKIPILDETDTPQYLLGISEDITERKNLEVQLRQVQKMEAIGQLAGGIAHDFNNILSAITGYSELSLSILDPKSEACKYLTQVMEASGRAKELVNQILMFSRETVQELRPIRVALPVKEALKLIRASVPATIEMRLKILSRASALADPTQIHQIVMNLCTNAAQAMRDSGGILKVQLTDITIDSGDGRQRYPDAKPGAYIRLAVSDQGHGIDTQYLHRIFDPFFTTKKRGEGTGMGLSVVHGIVKSYGGFIYAQSQLGKGSLFEILLPAQEPAAAPRVALELPVPTGCESILFVDDETMIVDIVQRMLESLGYRVTAKTSAIEALDVFKINPDSFDLVVTDMTMPKMTGLDLAEKIFQIRPGFPIVLCTGFDVTMNEEKIAEHGLQDIIYKPILRRNMATVVRKVLDSRRSAKDNN